MKVILRRITLFFLLPQFIIAACKNPSSKRDEVLREFDSINQRLNKLNDETDQGSASLYDAIAEQNRDTTVRQFKSSILVIKEYIQDLQMRFVIACGGNQEDEVPDYDEDDLEITHQFFIKEKNGEQFYKQLNAASKIFQKYSNDPVLVEKVSRLTKSPKAEGAASFANAFFNKVPPVAALTILRKFANDINVLEQEVLQTILKEVNVPQN